MDDTYIKIQERLERLHSDSVCNIGRTGRIIQDAEESEQERLHGVVRGLEQAHQFIDAAVFDIQNMISKRLEKLND